MPDAGRLTEQRLPHTLPFNNPLYPPPPWELKGASVVKVVYETDAEAVLEWLPPKLTRSSPPYAVITVAYFPESPVGEFSLAAQHIGCRAGFFIRALTLQAVTDSASSLAALREVWGYPCRPGQVGLRIGREQIEAYVSEEDVSVMAVRLTDAQEIGPDLVRFDPVLNLRLFPSLEEGKRHDLLQMVQIDPDYSITNARRAGARLDFPGGDPASPWAVLPVRNMVSAVWCEMDTELPLARFVMPY